MLIGHLISPVVVGAECKDTDETQISSSLTKVTDSQTGGEDTSPTQCAYECRKAFSGFCPFFAVGMSYETHWTVSDPDAHEAGKCWREKPTGTTDCTKEGKWVKGPYILYNVQNIGNDFSLNMFKLIIAFNIHQYWQINMVSNNSLWKERRRLPFCKAMPKWLPMHLSWNMRIALGHCVCRLIVYYMFTFDRNGFYFRVFRV